MVGILFTPINSLRIPPPFYPQCELSPLAAVSDVTMQPVGCVKTG